MMGIVHHANYFQYFEVGRVDYLQKRGIGYGAWLERHLQMPLVEASVRYRKPARFDDELTLHTFCVETKRATVKFGYRLYRGPDLLCEAETLLACVGDDLAPKRLPDDLVATLLGPERESSSRALSR